MPAVDEDDELNRARAAEVDERVEVPEGGRVEVKVPEIDGELGVEVVEAA